MGNFKSSRYASNRTRTRSIRSVTHGLVSAQDIRESCVPYEPILPPVTKPWELLFSGTVESFRAFKGTYGLENASEPCDGVMCSQLAECKEQIQSKLQNKTKKILIERHGRTAMVVPWTADKTLMKILLHQNHRYRPYVVAIDTKGQLIAVTFQISESMFMTRHILVLDLTSRSLRFVLQPLEDYHSALHCDFSPDSSVIGILYKNKQFGTEYDFYMVSSTTGRRIHCTTLVTSVAYPAPKFVFDPRYRYSRIVFVSRVLHEGGTRHLIEIYSQFEDRIIKELEFAPVLVPELYVEPTTLVFSPDGQIIVMQTVNRMNRTYCNYIFSSDDLQLLKFFRFQLFPRHNSCPVNNRPAFSRCCSFMRMFDQDTTCHWNVQGSDNDRMSEEVIKIFRLPNLVGLQYHCRRVILQTVRSFDDINHLPIPRKMKSFLKFEPNQN